MDDNIANGNAPDESSRQALLSQYLKDYSDTALSERGELDKAIISLSATILIASCGFILHYRDVVSALWLSDIALILLFLAFILTMMSYLIAIHHAEQGAQRVAAAMKNNKKYSPENSRKHVYVDLAAAICFVFGIISILAFYFLNLY